MSVAQTAIAGVETLSFEALGGTCDLFAIEPHEPLAEAAEWIHEMHRRLTRFDADSELSRTNARAGEWVDVSPELHALLVAALDAYDRSRGLVNAAVLPALLAAGYDRTFDEVVARSDARPSPAAVAVPPLPAALEVRPGRARIARGAAIDLGGLAKGWIADHAVQRIGPNSLASCGGDLRARGSGPDGEGWPVGFGDRTVLLEDTAAATSGTTKRRWGNGLHHLIDPRTGRPADTDLHEVSVLARTALQAEVLAKTALLLGSSEAAAFLGPRSLGWALS